MEYTEIQFLSMTIKDLESHIETIKKRIKQLENKDEDETGET